MFRGEDSNADLTFTIDNQGESLCVDVLAVDNQVLENLEVFNVSIATNDSAVDVPRVLISLVVFDDDSKNYTLSLEY